MSQAIKIIIEKRPDECRLSTWHQGVIVGQGDCYDETLSDVKSAIVCHLETFGPDFLEDDERVLDAFVTEARVAV